MHNVMAADSASVGEESNPAGGAGSGTGRERIRRRRGHARDAAGAANDQAARAGVELTQRNAETLQQALQCGARPPTRPSERSADQLDRTIGMSGEGAEEAAQRSTRNFEAIVQSAAVLTEITQRLFEEWVDVARAGVNRGFVRFDAFLHCRTLQDCTALSSELMRDNMETFLGFVRRAGEQSAHIAGQAPRQAAGAGDGRAA